MPSLIVTCYVCSVDILGKPVYFFFLQGNRGGIVSEGGGRRIREEKGDASVGVYCMREEHNKKYTLLFLTCV